MLPSSTSVAVAEHVRSVPVTTELLGEMEASKVKIGVELDTVVVALLAAESPCVSVAVAVQTMSSPTSVWDAAMV